MKRLQTIRMVLIVVTAVCTVCTNSADAGKSLYAITEHVASTLKAYEIQGDQLDYQGNITVDKYASGAVDVTIDSNLELLFVTYEDSPKIIWANARTLDQEGYIDLQDIYPAAGQLAGIVADEQKNLVYTVERGHNKLYMLSWDAEQEKLVLMDPNNPNQPYDPNTSGGAYKTLTNLPRPYAYGLALDGNRLYVSNNTTEVHYYDTDTWAHLGGRNVGRPAMGIAADPNNGQHPAYLYIGGFNPPDGGGSHCFLIKHNLQTGTNTEQDIGTAAIGLAVDDDSGLVYTTTLSRELRVYDCSTLPFVCTYSEGTQPQTSGPGGLCVPSGEVEYIPPVAVSKNDGLAENECVRPRGGEIIYSICYKYQWNDPENPSAPASEYNPSNFKIVDYLAPELVFEYASDDGTYAGGPPGDPNHFVTWDIGQLAPGAEDCFELGVRTSRLVPAGGTVRNRCVISYDMGPQHYEKPLEIGTNICDCSCGGEVIHVDKNVGVPGDGSSWQQAFASLSDALAAAWPCDEVWVADGTYYRTAVGTDPNAAFVVPASMSVYGGFAGSEQHRYERNWLANETILSGQDSPHNTDYVVRVGADTAMVDSVLDGFVIQDANGPGVYTAGGPTVIQHNKITNNIWGILCVHGAAPAIRNNWIYGNAEGIRLELEQAGSAVIRNNTIANNSVVGVKRVSGPQPVITNCIIWGHPSANNLAGCSATYSCLEDPNNCRSGSSGNIIGCNPQFHDVGAFDYHLAYNSPCKDAGDPDNTYGPYFGESDIDHQQRRADGNDDGIVVVDMGADEYCSSGSNPADLYNEQEFEAGRVTFKDCAVLAAAWMSDPNDGNWNANCDLVVDNVINLCDLNEFVADWLEQACWTTPLASEIDFMIQAGGGGGMMSMGMAGGGEAAAVMAVEGGLAAETSVVFSEQESIDVDIDAIVDWLQGLWQQEEEIRSTTSEADWQAFVESVKSATGG